MDKFIRNVNELLWRDVKAHAALEGKSMKDWVEEVIELGLAGKIRPDENFLQKHKENDEINKSKLIRNISEDLWNRAKAQAALEGKTMKDYIEELIVERLRSLSKS